MNHILKTNLNELSFQESTALLAARGIQLTPKDLLALKQTQQLVCEKCKWIETSATILEQVLSPFLHSPYMSTQNYLKILKSAIVAYYEVRSRFDWHIDDTRIIKELYDVYWLYQGETDIAYLKAVLGNLMKERATLK